MRFVTKINRNLHSERLTHIRNHANVKCRLILVNLFAGPTDPQLKEIELQMRQNVGFQ